MGYVAPVIPQTESPGLADFFQGIRKEQAQRNQQRAELLLGQQRLSAETAQNQAQNDLSGRRVAVEENRAKDEQEAHKSEVAQQVTAALDAGRPDLAHQIAKRYPGLLDSITTQKPAPPPAGSGDSLLPPSIESPNPNPVPGRRTTPADSAHEAIAATADNPDATAEDLVAAREKADNARTDFDQANSPTTFTRAPDATAPPPETKYTVNGLSYDPNEANRADIAKRTRMAEVQRQAFAPFGEKAQALAAGAANADPKTAGLVSTMIEKDQAEQARKEDKATQREFQHEENAQYRRTFGQAMTLAEINAAGRERAAKAGANAGPKTDAETRGDYNSVDRAVDKQWRQAGMDRLQQASEAMESAKTNISSPNLIAHRDAMVQLARAVRQAQPVQGEMDLLYHDLGGTVERGRQMFQNFENGDITDFKQDQLKGAVGIMEGHMNRLVDRRYQQLSKGLGSDPALRNYGDVVNARIKGRFASFGRDVPDVMESSGEATPVLGAATHGNTVQRGHEAAKAKNADRAAAVKNGGARPSLDDLARQSGL